MYWEYFHLKTNPFGITPDPRYLFMSTPHASAIEWMKLAIEQHEFGLIIGEVGSGKTVLSRYLVDSLSEDKYKVAWIINPTLTATQLLREICLQLFDQDPPRTKSNLLNLLHEGLVNLFMEGKYPVVIIDEAQSISGTKIFEELRLLSNYQTDEQNLLSVVLLGQPELAKKLKRKSNRAFLQRVRFTMELNPLSSDEVGDYLMHRLKVAGYENEGHPFTDEAIERLYEITGGFPRPLNHLAAFSMMEAMSREESVIDRGAVNDAAKAIIYFEDQLASDKRETVSA